MVDMYMWSVIRIMEYIVYLGIGTGFAIGIALSVVYFNRRMKIDTWQDDPLYIIMLDNVTGVIAILVYSVYGGIMRRLGFNNDVRIGDMKNKRDLI